MMSSSTRANNNKTMGGTGTSKPESAQTADAEFTPQYGDVNLEPVIKLLTAVEKLSGLLQNAKTDMKSVEDTEQVNKELQKTVVELRKSLESTVEDNSRKVQSLNALVEDHKLSEADYKEKCDAANQSLSKVEEHYRKLAANFKLSKADVEKLSREKANLLNRIDALETENHKFNKELSECKSRLSKLLSDRLTNNNPQIADLSDPNRPTKLAEKHSELYDNLWTDAFEELQKTFDEKQSIARLLHCLMTVHQFCTEKAAEQVSQLKKVAFMQQTEGGQSSDTAELKSMIKEIRKHTAELSVHNVCKDFAAIYPKYAEAANIWKYVEACVQLCWLMNAQDPPVVFAAKPPENTKFNIELYRPYTQSGEIMEYVVWPAILLHKGGSLLARGVAQGHATTSGNPLEAFSKPIPGDPNATNHSEETIRTSSGRTSTAWTGFEDAHAKKEPPVTAAYPQGVNMSTRPGTQNNNGLPIMAQQNIRAPSTPGPGSAVMQTNQAESTVPTQAGTAATNNSNLGAPVRVGTSQNMASTQSQQNWSQSVGRTSTSHGIAIPSEQEYANYCYYWNTNGEHYCRDMMGQQAFDRCRAYNHSLYFPKQ